MQDGNGGAGALDPGGLENAMLAAFNAKQPAAEKTTTSDGQAADTQTATEDNTQADATTQQEDQTTQQQEESEYNFDEDNFVGARDLTTQLEAHNLPDDLKNQLLANARIAEQLAPYREIFGSPDEARVIAQAANDYSVIQSTFQSITPENVGEGTSNLLNKMLELSAYRDENGKPRRREDGTYITDGTTTRFLNELFDRKFNAAIVKKIEASGNEAAKAALDLVMESAGLRASTADKTQVDPTVAAERAQLEADRKQLREQQEAGRKETVRTYNDTLNGDLNTVSQTAFDSLLAHATGLDGLTKTAVLTRLSKAVTAAIKADTGYQLEKRALQSQPMSADRRQKEVALAKKWMASSRFTKVAKPILAEAGITVGKKAASKQEQQAAREKASRGEVNGGAVSSTNKPVNMKNPAQARAQVSEALKARLNRTPTENEINVEMMLNLPGIKGRAA
jgi:hypothetical protein